jgi:transposase
MASIVHYKKGGITYLYESVSFRKNGRPENKRTLIGKLDPKTGNPVYKRNYIERMNAAGTPVAALEPATSFTDEEIRNSLIKAYGAFHLYLNIAEHTGLLPILQEVFPEKWKAVFDLACFLVSTGEPVMYCQDWSEKAECFPADLSSGAISLLLQSLSRREQEAFFRMWGAYRSEREYLALDITSVSSYSELVELVEWGYNRDGEKLPQVNLCLLMGERSRLPVFHMLYNGSLKDVSTLRTSLEATFSIGAKHLTLVLDKGFYSRKNMDFLLQGREKSRFLVSVPFTVKAAKDLVRGAAKVIDKPELAIALSERESIQGLTRRIDWEGKHPVYAHIYYNTLKAVQVKNSLYGYVASLVGLAKTNPLDCRLKAEFDKYLVIRKQEKTGSYSIRIRHDVVELEYAHSGWMVLISGHLKDSGEALMIYRGKDVVEKGFYRLKDDLDLHRLRIHSDNAMRGKVFIGFIALIIMSHIHVTMAREKLYKKWTLKELLKYLDQLHLQYISGNRILYPLTRKQKEIYQAFSTKNPV